MFGTEPVHLHLCGIFYHASDMSTSNNHCSVDEATGGGGVTASVLTGNVSLLSGISDSKVHRMCDKRGEQQTAQQQQQPATTALKWKVCLHRGDIHCKCTRMVYCSANRSFYNMNKRKVLNERCLFAAFLPR